MMKDCGSKEERNTGKNKTVLKVEDFRLCFNGRFGAVHAVRDANLEVHEGEIVALVGESGCGKTALCRAILMLHSAHARYLSGRILLDGRDVRTCSEREMELVRGRAASLVFQNPMSSLNPVYRIREQLEEPMRRHLGMKDAGALEARSRELLLEMGLPDPEEILVKYPHQLSGGQRQRVAVAIALAGDPSLIIADEPTTALDPETAKMVMGLLRRVADEKQKGILFVTHDLAVAAELADRVLVMKEGEILEQGTTEDIFARPKDAYTKKLVRCAEWVRGEALPRTLESVPEKKLLTSVRHLRVRYPGAHKPALRDCSLDIRERQIHPGQGALRHAETFRRGGGILPPGETRPDFPGFRSLLQRADDPGRNHPGAAGHRESAPGAAKRKAPGTDGTGGAGGGIAGPVSL